MGDFLQTRYREITLSAVVFGVLVGAVMNAAITYAGLKIGFTLGGSAIAAVLGFGVLRGLLRRGTILETNIGQTVASAVNTSNSGVIFTVPVLFLTGHDMVAGSADFWLITLACSAGAVLGAALIIPLRKQMIDIERLRFPTGTAVASILKSPGAGPAKAIVLLAGIAVGMAIFFPTQLGLLKIGALGGHGLSHLPVVGIEADLAHGFVDDETVDVGKLVGLPSEMQLVFAIAPFALGAGYLTGRAGLYVLAGGLLAFFVITPLAFRMEWMPATVTADAAAQYGYGAYNRPLGIGLLLGGGLMGILAALPAIVQACRSVGDARRVS
ncbi:MAG: OPT/YSL family transporter, partial [Pirellulales bacterium]